MLGVAPVVVRLPPPEPSRFAKEIGIVLLFSLTH